MKTGLLPLAPLRFRPVYKDYVWGGSRIAARYGRAGTPPVCAESWEVSAHPNGMSVVVEGPLEGERLDAICERHGRTILGANAPDGHRFPLLFKIIDARENLSVQVHPSPADPSAAPGDIKNEAWFALDSSGAGGICAGFRKGVTRRILEEALADDGRRIGALLNRVDVADGETLFVRAGLVHAICAGCLVYEIQQCADVTYRFYDWGRVGADGRGRRLHVAEALRSIDWALPEARPEAPRPVDGSPGLEICLATSFFTLYRASPAGPMAMRTGGESFHVLFANRGKMRVSTKDGRTTLATGSSALVPAAADKYELAPLEPGSTVLVTRL